MNKKLNQSKLSKYNKVLYICKTHKETGLTRYYKKEFLMEDLRWGKPREITKKTFEKRIAEGYPFTYGSMKQLPEDVMIKLNDIRNMIDLALDIKDKKWFMELTKQREMLFES